VVVVKNMNEFVTSIQSDSVERRLNTLTKAMDQLMQDVQVKTDTHIILLSF